MPEVIYIGDVGDILDLYEEKLISQKELDYCLWKLDRQGPFYIYQGKVVSSEWFEEKISGKGVY